MKHHVLRMLGVLTCLILCGAVHAGKGKVTYIYTDPQGTPIAEADEQGNITKTFDYRPYGQRALGQPPDGPGYTGHVNDPDTDLVYMQARYYDPEMGRFLSADPVGPKPGDLFGFNRYTYANNNPVVNIDPDGRETGPTYSAIYRLDGGVPQTYVSADDRVGPAIQIGMSLLPIVGDGVNIGEAIRNPSLVTIGAATLGVIAPAGGSAMARALKEAEAVKETALTLEQAKNIKRFADKVPANAKDNIVTRALPNEGVAVQATSPGRVPGSSAVYEKQIDASGKTVQYTKTTYDPNGNIVHVKDKITGEVTQ